MKVLFKYAAIAAAALTMGLTSCSNNNDLPDGGTIIPGEPTAMTMAISLPKVEQGRSATRAADTNATGDEIRIKDIKVLIYGQTPTGFTLESVTDRNIASDFTETPAGSNTYVLNSGKKITTTTGTKHIYVMANMPSTGWTLPGLSTTELTLIDYVKTISSATDLVSTSEGFVMFSTEAKIANLIKNPTSPTDNNVTATVARLVAKITLETSIDESTTAVLATTDGGWIKDLEYELFNNSTETYLFQHKNAAVVKSPNWGTTGNFLANPTPTYSVLPTSAIGTVSGPGAIKYATENTVDGNASNIGTGLIETYISIRGKYIPKFYSKADGTAEADNSAATATQTFWTVATTDGNFRYFKTVTDATTFRDTPGVTPEPGQPTEYTDGVCYYRGFFKVNDPDNPFGVVRNTYYKSTITEIKGLGAPTDAEVGTAQIETTLEMTVDVQPWATEPEDWILQ